MIYLFFICLTVGGFLSALSDNKELSGSNLIQKFTSLSFIILIGCFITTSILYKWWQAILIPIGGAIGGVIIVALVGNGRRLIVNIFFFLQLVALVVLITFIYLLTIKK
ncbi:hypothetical protein [Pedobacter nanyangensis]|uniref:hypothetical protein n=1 Tax=Pedobacter nanyangensis TaxID=1562389 RepID=UPI000DE43833|nr:hypothetical protein [Pedobacter nanyangensis]